MTLTMGEQLEPPELPDLSNPVHDLDNRTELYNHSMSIPVFIIFIHCCHYYPFDSTVISNCKSPNEPAHSSIHH
jgi:hypothetical protein